MSSEQPQQDGRHRAQLLRGAVPLPPGRPVRTQPALMDMATEAARCAMNEQNPPPYHLKKAEWFHKIQVAILAGCLGILVYLLVALDTKNLLTLILVLMFMALPLTVAYFVIDRRIRYWQSPYQLYSQEFTYKPKLKSGIHVPIQVEYHFPTAVNTPDVLDRIDDSCQRRRSTMHFPRSIFQAITSRQERLWWKPSTGKSGSWTSKFFASEF